MDSVRRSRFTGRGLSLLAALLVLFAQSAGIAHDLDAESTAPDHVCAVCIATAALDAADLAADRPILAVERGADEFVDPASAVIESGHSEPSARGPPATS